MAAGITLAEAVRYVGTENGTYGTDLIRALRLLGVRCSSRSLRFSKKRGDPVRAIVRVSPGPRKLSHWVLWWDGEVLDPAGSPLPADWTATSYVEIL
jgi:hypothetical protein